MDTIVLNRHPKLGCSKDILQSLCRYDCMLDTENKWMLWKQGIACELENGTKFRRWHRWMALTHLRQNTESLGPSFSDDYLSLLQFKLQPHPRNLCTSLWHQIGEVPELKLVNRVTGPTVCPVERHCVILVNSAGHVDSHTFDVSPRSNITLPTPAVRSNQEGEAVARVALRVA